MKLRPCPFLEKLETKVKSESEIGQRHCVRKFKTKVKSESEIKVAPLSLKDQNKSEKVKVKLSQRHCLKKFKTKVKKWEWNEGSAIVLPHYNLRTTIALLPHYQHTMWTQPECDVIEDEYTDEWIMNNGYGCSDGYDVEDDHNNQPLHLHGLHGSLHDKKSR